jgi:nucleoside-diphosphate-sugar epimerase
MIVAITGATGAVGRRLVERHVAAGDTVRALSRQEDPGFSPAVQIHRGELTSDANVLARFVDGADVLYHCAAEIHEPGRMMEINVGGTGSLIAAARGKVRRWIQLSSVAVYGAPEAGVIDEETPPQPIDTYGRSKAEADRVVLEAAGQRAFTCAVLRPAKVFGAGIDSANNQILFRLFSLVDRGLFFFIGKPGALTHYVHVDNLVEALMCCGSEPAANRVYNLSDDRPIEAFIAVVAVALGRKEPRLRLPEAPVRWVARTLGALPGWALDERRVAALVNRAAFPATRIERELGYGHRVPIEDGLRELVAFWRRHA